MKNFNYCIIVILTGLLSASCVSVKKYNENIYVTRTEKDLKKDVNYLHKKLQKLHPNLYWYITKQELDYKFDSLKTTITAPMTSNEFYYKISPLLASIRQGHNGMFPLVEKTPKKERKVYKETSLLSLFEYELFDNKLYIVKNNSADTSIQIGSEVISINNITPQEIYKNFVNSFVADGYIETHFPKMFGSKFVAFHQFYNTKILRDSALYQLKYNDTITEHRIVRTKKNTKTEKTETLDYIEADSSIALMTIREFDMFYRSFYKKSFEQLRSANTQALIIDLRNNGGGVADNIQTLYAYLTDTSYYLMSKAEVVSKTSLLRYDGVLKKPSIGRIILSPVLLPIVFIDKCNIFFKTKKEDGKYYYQTKPSKLRQHNPLHFNGEVYVLINGRTFSASCILSSNLHGAKRATFVGEETGGAYNGCVALKFFSFKLPKSKLSGRLGLATVKPFYQTDTEGRGIMPDMEILPTLEDRINGNDPELNATLDLIRLKRTENR